MEYYFFRVLLYNPKARYDALREIIDDIYDYFCVNLAEEKGLAK